MNHSIVANVVVSGVDVHPVVAALDSTWVVIWVRWFTVICTVGILLLIFAVPAVILWKMLRGPKKEMAADANPFFCFLHRLPPALKWGLAGCLTFFLACGITNFIIGYRKFQEISPPVAGSKTPIEIKGMAAKWAWSFQYVDGYVSDSRLVLPGDNPGTNPIHLSLVSKDVIHCFHCPDFRVKKDVVPGRQNELWVSPLYDPFDKIHAVEKVLVDPNERGASGMPKEYRFIVDLYPLACAQYCGQGHPRMIGAVVVVDPKEYSTYMRLLAAQPRPASSSAAAQPMRAAF